MVFTSYSIERVRFHLVESARRQLENEVQHLVQRKNVNGVLHQTTRLNAEIESKFCGECAEAAREWGDFMLENFHHNLFE